MNWPAIIFFALVANQLAATIAFIFLYLRESDWRRSAVGRHLLYWSTAAGALDLSWILLLVVRWPFLAFVLLGVQALVGGLTWQRVVLVRRAQRR